LEAVLSVSAKEKGGEGGGSRKEGLWREERVESKVAKLSFSPFSFRPFKYYNYNDTNSGWQVSSWFEPWYGNFIETEPINVNPGDHIKGEIALSGTNWNITGTLSHPLFLLPPTPPFP
jgi:hypothetical protein